MLPQPQGPRERAVITSVLIAPNHRVRTTENTDNLHIHIIANRISLGGQVYDTTFVGNRAERVAEELSRKYRLTIAKEVTIARLHRKAQADPARERTKQQVRSICYDLLDRHRGRGLSGHSMFLHESYEWQYFYRTNRRLRCGHCFRYRGKPSFGDWRDHSSTDTRRRLCRDRMAATLKKPSREKEEAGSGK